MNTPFCKYCLETYQENPEPIIYPCNCSDGVHKHCLLTWLTMKENKTDYTCEICKINYQNIMQDILPQSSTHRLPPQSLALTINTLDTHVANQNIPEFNCCNCKRIECNIYISGAIFNLTGFFMCLHKPTPSEYQNYYAGIVILMLVSCLFYVLGISLTTKRYFDRFNDHRAINTTIDE